MAVATPLFFSCGDDDEKGGGSAGLTGVEIQGVANPLELAVGEVLVVDITTAPVNVGKDGNVKFSSSNKKVFTVTEREGHIKATGVGEAVLTVSVVGAPDIRSERRVVVTNRLLDVAWADTELVFQRNPLPVADINLNEYLRATPEEAAFDVVFETQYDTIAAVDTNGILTAVGYGETDLTVRIEGTNFSATTRIKIEPVLVERIVLPAGWDPVFRATAGASFQTITLPLEEIIVLPENANNKALITTPLPWSGDDIWTNGNQTPRIAQTGFTSFGLRFQIAAKPKGVGTATFTLQSQDGGAQKEITVISTE